MLKKIAILYTIFSMNLSLIAMDYPGGEIPIYDSFFEDRKAEEKYNLIWDYIATSPYRTLPPFKALEIGTAFELFFSPKDLAQAFTHKSDFRPADLKKLLHGQGTTIGVKLVVKDSRIKLYSGMLREGAPYGIMRASFPFAPKEDSCTPSIAIKFFRDYKPSVNIMAMPNFDGIAGHNFFSTPFTTNLPEPSCPLKAWFGDTSFGDGAKAAGQENPNPRAFSIDHLANTTTTGMLSQPVSAPYALVFKPSPAAANLLAGIKPSDDFRAMLEGKGRDITLFYVYAAGQNAEDGQAPLAELVATTDFKASSFGDDTLFFSHPPMQELPPEPTFAEKLDDLWEDFKKLFKD